MKHVIIGNGPAGVIAAETIRKRCPDDEIVLIGDELSPPYSRMAIPYLLVGNIDESGTYLRKTAKHFEQLKIQQLQGRVLSLDAKNKSLQVEEGNKKQQQNNNKTPNSSQCCLRTLWRRVTRSLLRFSCSAVL